jgi:hypothetical protein
MNISRVIIALSISLLVTFTANSARAEKCTNCHKERFNFSRFHSPTAVSCEQCHGGNPEADHKETAHFDLEAYPGRMETVEKSCGQSRCHADLVPLAKNSIMNTLDGMLTVTRRVLRESDEPHGNRTVGQRLAESGADSYLRKLCVSCHLGSERRNHLQSFKDRGGGCAACHLQTYVINEVPPALDEQKDLTGLGKTHPSLTIQISNDRCFGCHSRSGRISLNYLGLAETDTIDNNRVKDFGYLYDNRLVEQKATDLHHAADMACIDCHTANGVMGMGIRVPFQRDQNDIGCDDCHAPERKSKPLHSLSPRERKYFSLYQDRISLTVTDSVLLTAKRNSPLFNIIQKENKRVMFSKLSGKELEIPLTGKEFYHTVSGHERMTCDSCHTAWVPQCYGCHVEFKPDKAQWDHTLGKTTAGQWVETRWFVKSELPTLGVSQNSKITTFVPGMNIIAKKSPQAPLIQEQVFAATSAHTTRKAGRSCASCHQSDAAIGIINSWAIHADHPDWKTPVGWITEGQQTPGKATKPGDRSFNREEIDRIRKVGRCLTCHADDDKIYQNYDHSLKNLSSQCNEFR